MKKKTTLQFNIFYKKYKYPLFFTHFKHKYKGFLIKYIELFHSGFHFGQKRSYIHEKRKKHRNRGI